MIHYWMADLLEAEIPELTWTVNNFTDDQDKGIVYQEGGGQPDIYERETSYPEYMIYIRSKDHDKAFRCAMKAKRTLHRRGGFVANTDYGDYHVSFIQALGEPIRIGLTENKIMEYSVNVRATLNAIN
jgi:Bacteriophage minor capsid protein